MTIGLLDESEILRRLGELSGLLHDAVEHGASIGYTLPLDAGETGAYWRGVAAGVKAGGRVVIAACETDGALIGSGQLALEMRSNGRHRAEVQKVMVRHAARGRGIGAALMARLEAEAAARKRTLLFLDTSVGAGGAVDFYTRLGYLPAGSIPDYAAAPDGTLHANAIFYKKLA